MDWSTHGDALVERGPFDLVLAADVLYTRANVERRASAVSAPGRARRAAASSPTRIAPGRSTSCTDFEHTTEPGKDVSLHTLRFD